jgi:hypothetical protein
MSLDLGKLVHNALAMAFGLGPPIVRDCSYFRPPSGTAVATCKAIVSPVRSAEFLGFASVAPGTEILIVRCAELLAITSPVPGDYLIETNGLRRDVIAARADLADEFFSLQCERA